jgi:ecotin
MKSLVVVLVVLGLAGMAGGQPGGQDAQSQMRAYPAAEQGVTRFVLTLPAQEREADYRVELIVGQTAQTDPVNSFFLGGEITAENIEGWGYTRYVVKSIGPMGGTLMAPPPGAAPVERFVTLGGEPYLIRYNSRLPVVVYVPDGAEVRYRIWKAEPDAKAMERG